MVIPRSPSPLLLLLASIGVSAGESSPSTLSLGERIHDSDTLPMSGPIRADDRYVENSIDSVGYSISIKGGPFQLNPKHGKSILKARSEFQCESDPLSSGSVSIDMVYRLRPAALSALSGTPMTLTYYVDEGGLIFPTTISDTTAPRLCAAVRKARALQLKDVAALKTLSGKMLLVISLGTLGSTLELESGAVVAQGVENATAGTLARQALLVELRAAGMSFTESAIQGITRTLSGRVVWLETGSGTAGLTHIFARHGAQFAQWGLQSARQISEFLIRIVGSQTPVAATEDAFDYVVMIDGAEKMLRIVIGSNGFIVTAHPL